MLRRFFFRRVIVIELLHKYVIPLDPRTKKNHQTIAGTGPKCPFCGKRAKQFIRQGRASTEFSLRAAPYLQPRPREPIGGKVRVKYRLYMQTRRRVDDLNLYAALDDILVAEGILKDDNIGIVRDRDGSRVLYDKENPRAEIYIYEYKEEEDHELRHEDVFG